MGRWTAPRAHRHPRAHGPSLEGAGGGEVVGPSAPEDALVVAAFDQVRARLAVQTIGLERPPHWHDLPVLRRDGAVQFPGTSLPLDADVLSRCGVEIPMIVGNRRLGRLVVRLHPAASADEADRIWLARLAVELAEALAARDERSDLDNHGRPGAA